jgi:hypothetical protein
VKIAIKYQVKESWNPRPFMVELNRTARNVMAPNKSFTGEIPVYDRNDSQQVKDFSLNEKQIF